jgi:anaerobic selenocysteine-containing dehydrogenase
MERPDMGNFCSIGAYPLIQMGEAAVPPVVEGRYERYDDYRFWRALGLRLGQGEHWPQETFEELWEYRLGEIMEERGIGSLSEFVTRQRWVKGTVKPGECYRGLATPSGRVEIYSTILEKLGYDPLPGYTEPESLPEEWQGYRLLNISGARTMPYHHSEYRHLPGFRKQHPDPMVEIHVDLARKKGIADGDWVWIETPLGRCRQRARLTTSLDQDVICTQHAWWFPEEEAAEPSLYGVWEANINVTTDDDPDRCDPLSGGWPFKGQYMRCRISRVEQGARNGG